MRAISFFPLGADFNASVCRIITSSGADYFLKLRSGEFLEASVLIPRYLADSGLKPVLPPIATGTEQLWTSLASFMAILYSYMDGRNAVDAPFCLRAAVD
ncbi:MAG: hypothetical protein IRD7MM_05720 [Candidatus Midichloria mitochondrii]|nr:hypothetical protein [Candidatus Midichloria mitochondrii]MDJ1313186.1 hypothetical protein [Candidatus Midichloria mitochondrii]MDJ1583682.1 hypothetical protein [Candidatus Midichloria mitochondrii]